MLDSELYERVLGLKAPWKVSSVDLRMEESKVTVTVSHDPTARFECPECGQEAATYDHRRRQWRHLDTCGLVTMIEFEALAISWLKVAPVNAVGERLGISWDQAWGIMNRAVSRGLERRQPRSIRELGIDETSFQKPHEYLTVLVDRSDGTVVDILDDRKKATLKGWLEDNQRHLQQLRSVSMDMWEPYIRAVSEVLEATEHRALLQAGGTPLTRTKYDWLRSRANDGYRDKRAFLRLTRRNLKTVRAWRIKEAASTLWSYSYRGVAERN